MGTIKIKSTKRKISSLQSPGSKAWLQGEPLPGAHPAAAGRTYNSAVIDRRFSGVDEA
jgi:hypothetical protein